MVIQRIPGDSAEGVQKDRDDEKRPWWEFWGGGGRAKKKSSPAPQAECLGGRGRRRRKRIAGFASVGVGEKVMNSSPQVVAGEAEAPPRRKRTTGMEPSVVGEEAEEENWMQKRRGRETGGGSSSTSVSEGAAFTRRWIEGCDAARREYWVTGQDSGSQVKTMVLKDTRAPLQRVVDGFLNRFFPLGYPNSVSEGYLVYSQYRAAQHFASAILAVLSTQSLLFAAGLRPTPAQATIASWVLKDGMQHIGKFICSSMGAQMDSEPKRWRIFADAMYDVGVGLEVISPMCPQHFLQVAGLANMAKGMALVSARATRLPIYTSFARESNLSDLYAKGEAISTLSNVIGLGVGIRLASTVCSSIQGKLLVAPWLSAIHIYCVAQEMRAAPINTLNSQRTALLVADFMKTGIVSRPAALRYRERLILPNVLNKEAGNVRVGAPLMRVVSRPSALAEIKQQFPEEKFLLRFADKGTDLVLHQSATGVDAVRGWLVAAYAHKMACDHACTGEEGFAFQKAALLKEAFEETEKVFPTFLQGLQENGWHIQLFQSGSGHRAVW